jgi:hypothetical protein
MRNKLFIAFAAAAFASSGCFEGVIKKYTRMKSDVYPQMREALATNPSITSMSSHGIRIDAPHLRNTAKDMQSVEHMASENTATNSSKELGKLLGKLYPLTKMKFDASLKKLRTGNLGGIISGSEPEYDIPASVTDEYVIAFNWSGNYDFVPSERRNINGEILGRLGCKVSLSLSLINAKTRKEIGRYVLGEAFQTWEDVTENSFKGMADNGTVDRYPATKAYNETLTAAKAGVQQFVTEIKNSKSAASSVQR